MTPWEAEQKVAAADKRATNLIRMFHQYCWPVDTRSGSARECRRMARAWGRTCERWLAEYRASVVTDHRVEAERAARHAAIAWDKSQDWQVQADRYGGKLS